MLNFQSVSVSQGDNRKELQDWYILVASTTYAISAQLISVPSTNVPDIIVPDFIQCTPISVWACHGASAGKSSSTNANVNPSNNSSNSEAKVEVLNCDPVILIQEPTTSQSEYLQVAIICGTDQNRVLSVQLTIYAYVGISGCEGRYVLSKTQREDGIVEPLPIDTDDGLRRWKLILEGHSSSHSQLGNGNGNGNGHVNSFSNKVDDGNTSITSASKDEITSKEAATNDKLTAFRPEGGVASISPLYKHHGLSPAVANDVDGFLWVTYGDGTFVRMPKWAFFALDDLSDLDHRSHHCKDLAVKGKLDLSKYSEGHVIVPLPRYFPTLLSQPVENSPASGIDFLDNVVDDGEEDQDEEEKQADRDYEFYEAISYKHDTGSGSDATAGDTYPTLAFYTNEDQLFSNTHKAVEEEAHMSTVQNIIRGGTTIIGGTAAIARGIFGGMLGVLGRSKATVQEEEEMNGMEIGGVDSSDDVMDIERSTRASLFPVLYNDPTVLSLGSALYDAPRRITHVAIDPLEGKLMACADNLGRVQLIDLATKQSIRM